MIHNLKTGMHVTIAIQKGDRDGIVLAVLDQKALIEYEIKGQYRFVFADVYACDIKNEQTIVTSWSKPGNGNRVSKKWITAIDDQGITPRVELTPRYLVDVKSYSNWQRPNDYTWVQSLHGHHMRIVRRDGLFWCYVNGQEVGHVTAKPGEWVKANALCLSKVAIEKSVAPHT